MSEQVLTPGFVIRQAKNEDMDAVCRIAQIAWVRIHDSFRKIMGADMHDVLCANWEENKAGQVRGQFEQHPEGVYVVIQEESGHVVGFVTMRVNMEKSLGTIGNNAIDPSVQGRGVGSAMHRFALDRFKETGLRFASVTTGLDEGHAPARRAYEKAGFDIRQEDVTYYKKL
ncbi:MAG: GNAT family N-acetyltransferase [Candidatus Latescibacteria bacterium]|jgi:ribosomal protein S18 acetylase RimI-like enzyme|nr:GNAT family N-acetyltransferase [Candidatus Latescibacterota bacterium]